MVHPYDHYRATENADVRPGVYRVVGTGDPIALLRITDADGNRTTTGQVETVSRETFADQFEEAANPDAGISLRSFLPPVLTWAKAASYWVRNLFR